jgi:PAS domain S-box-containing protein
MSDHSNPAGLGPEAYVRTGIAVFSEGSIIPMMAVDKDLRYVFANKAYCEAIGREQVDILGQYVTDVYQMPPEDRDSFIRKCKATFAGEVTRSEVRTSIVPDASGRTRAINWQTTQEPFYGGAGEVIYIVQRVEDVTHLVELQKSHDVVTAELDHRVKNLISVVLAMARITSSTAQSVEQYTEEFCARLESVARIYNRMSDAGWTGLRLKSLFEDELAQVAGGRAIEYSLKGEDILLTVSATKDGGMVIHEMASNALKYGCFSQAGGRLDVEWSFEDGCLRILWVESGVTGIRPPDKEGFGTKLITMLPNARVKRDYRETGLRIEYIVPIDLTVDGEPDLS